MKDKSRGGFIPEIAVHCDDVARLVWVFLDGELDPRGAASIRIHLRECPSCRAFVRFERTFLRAMHAALRGASREPSS